MIMLLRNEENIREVVAFPMNSNAQDLLCAHPAKLPNSNCVKCILKSGIKRV